MQVSNPASPTTIIKEKRMNKIEDNYNKDILYKIQTIMGTILGLAIVSGAITICMIMCGWFIMWEINSLDYTLIRGLYLIIFIYSTLIHFRKE